VTAPAAPPREGDAVEPPGGGGNEAARRDVRNFFVRPLRPGACTDPAGNR
jgi:hypothetical protein